MMSIQMLKLSLAGVGTIALLERNAWSMFEQLGKASKEYALRSKHQHKCDDVGLSTC